MVRLAWSGLLIGPRHCAGQVPSSPVCRSRVDLVTLDVAVTRRGTPFAGLVAEDFLVTDDGVPQTVLSVSAERLPIDLTLVVDMSGSVRGAVLASLRLALDTVVARLTPEDAVRVLRFNHRLLLDDLTPFTDRPKAGAAIGEPTGHTSLFDALCVALVTESRPNRRELTIVFSDGEDTTSLLGEDTVIELARRAGGAVFVVSVSDSTTGRHANERLLRELAATTGGRLALLQRRDAVDRSFVQAFDDFRTSYVLRYEATGVDRPGWHQLGVSVRNRSDLSVRARTGYFR
jgi:VWFA-related protein